MSEQALSERLKAINELLREAEAFAAKHDMVIGPSRNVIGTLGWSDVTCDHTPDEAKLGWVSSSICD